MNNRSFDMKISNRDKDKYKQFADDINGYEVTMDSIQRVPCVQITQDKNINNLIQVMHKKILYETIVRQDGHKFDEVGCLLEIVPPYKNTNMIYGYYDKDREVSHINVHDNEEYIDYLYGHSDKQLLFMHTHPHNSSLSYGDIWNLIMTDSIYAVTAVCNHGGVYTAYKGDAFNSIEMQRRLTKFDSANRNMGKEGRIKLEHQLLHRLQSEQNKYEIIFRYSIRR